jgi:hypothetical protein
MRYSADGSDEAGGAGGNGGAPPHPARTSATAAAMARKYVRCTLRSCSAFHTSANIDYQQVVDADRGPRSSRFAVVYYRSTRALYHQRPSLRNVVVVLSAHIVNGILTLLALINV